MGAEIEVTPKMIEAGLNALAAHSVAFAECGEDELANILVLVFGAMLRAQPRSTSSKEAELRSYCSEVEPSFVDAMNEIIEVRARNQLKLRHLNPAKPYRLNKSSARLAVSAPNAVHK